MRVALFIALLFHVLVFIAWRPYGKKALSFWKGSGPIFVSPFSGAAKTRRGFSSTGELPSTKKAPSQDSSLSLDHLLTWGNDAPIYPEEARSRGWQGRVKVRVEFDTAGNADHWEVVESSGYAVLDSEVIRTAHQWHVPVSEAKLPFSVVVPVEFMMSD